MKNTRLILYSLRLYLAPFTTDYKKRTILRTITGLTFLFLWTKSKKGGKVNFLHGRGLFAFGFDVRFHTRFMLAYEKDRGYYMAARRYEISLQALC